MIRGKVQAIKIADGLAAAGAGVQHAVSGARIGLYYEITGTATVSIQTSPDGTLWVDTTITGKTASGYSHLDQLHRYVRANVTAWTSGVVNVWVAELV